MAVQTTTPSSIKVATSHNFIDSLSLAEGLHKPVVDNQLIRRYGRQDITGLIESLGGTKEIRDITFNHYEKDRIHGVVRASASAATAAAGTASGSFDVATAYTYEFTGQDPYPTADTFTGYTVRQYDIIEFNGWQAIVTSVSAGTATFYPVSSSVARPALATTDDIIILTNAHPEGSSSPESRNSQLLSYTNYLQTFRGKHRVTGTEAEVQTWIETQGMNGEKGYVWYLEGVFDEYLRFMNEREAALIAGVKINNQAGLAAAGSQIFGDADSIINTEGMIPQISGNGNVSNYTIGSFAESDLEDMTKDLQKYRGATKNMLAMGYEFRLELMAWLRDTSSAGTNIGAGGLIFNQFNGGGEQGVKFDFDFFEWGGFKFALQTLDIFSDPTFLGYAGGIYKNLGIVIPMDNTVTYNRMNSNTSERVPSCRVNHLSNRSYKEWVHGLGPNGIATHGEDYFDVEFLSQVGLEMFALNRWGLFVGGS